MHVRSATKDSLAVVWRGVADLDQPASTVVSGYKVRYQAVGSSVVQYSHLLKVGITPHFTTPVRSIVNRLMSINAVN